MKITLTSLLWLFRLTLMPLAMLPATPLAAEPIAEAAAQAAQVPLRILTEPAGRGRLKDKHGNIYGMSTQLVMAIQQQLGDSSRIEVLPWARAYTIALSSDNVAVYDTIRNADREHKFKWVGPIKIYAVNLYAKRDVVAANASLADLLQHHVVCETRNTSIANELLSLGFEIDKNLILSLQSDDCYQMLKLGRADLIAMHGDVTPKRMAQLLDAGLDLQAVYPLQNIEMYIAFSKQVEDAVILQWQCALNKLVLEGRFRQLYADEYPQLTIEAIESRAAKSQQQLQCH